MDRQHGTQCLPNDRLGDAPEQHTREALAAVRPHHDQIDLVLLGVSNDLFPGGAQAYGVLRPQFVPLLPSEQLREPIVGGVLRGSGRGFFQVELLDPVPNLVSIDTE